MPSPSTWVVFAFDWTRYRGIGPRLQAACGTGDFTSLGIPGADAVLDTLEDDRTPEEVCNVLLAELCGRGEPVTVPGALLGVLRQIRRYRDCEEAADLLTELLVGGSNVAPWFRTGHALVGLLTPEQTRALALRLGRFCRRAAPAARPGGLRSLWRLFSPSDEETVVLHALRDLVDEAAARGDGLAAAVD
jgi:hypothetical protein